LIFFVPGLREIKILNPKNRPSLTQRCKQLATASTTKHIAMYLGAMTQRWALQTFYMLMHNTASRMKGLVLVCSQLGGTSFFEYVDDSNRAELSKVIPRVKLADMRVVFFQKGSRSIKKIQTSHRINNEHKSLDLLKKKFNIKLFRSSRQVPHGVPASKCDDIVIKLCQQIDDNFGNITNQWQLTQSD